MRISLGYVLVVLEPWEGGTLVMHLIILLLILSCSQRRCAKESFMWDPDHRRKIISSSVVTCIQVLSFCLRKVSPSRGCNSRIPLDPGSSAGQKIQSIFPQTSRQKADMKERLWEKVKPEFSSEEWRHSWSHKELDIHIFKNKKYSPLQMRLVKTPFTVCNAVSTSTSCKK